MQDDFSPVVLTLSSGIQYQLRVTVDRQQLIKRWTNIPAVHSDLVDLAVAVYFADRFAGRLVGMPRRILIELPLSELAHFESETVKDALEALLFWLTEDIWSFKFSLRPDRLKTGQIGMHFEGRKTEVALWSGGLDSAAGLIHRAHIDKESQYVLVGTGSSSHIQSVQEKVFTQLSKQYGTRLTLIQVPVRLDDTKQCRSNSTQRARAFLFLIVGAVCALQEHEAKLHVYENGVGALNLPYRRSEVGVDHSRSTHPRTLEDVASLISTINEKTFKIVNPFLTMTKAQMCKTVKHLQLESIACSTVSCDSRHRRAGLPTQCGYCSSCWLRRMSLSIAGIADTTPYLIKHTKKFSGQHSVHICAMLHQVRVLNRLLTSNAPVDNLITHFDEISSALDVETQLFDKKQRLTREHLIALFQQYTNEWRSLDLSWYGLPANTHNLLDYTQN